MDPRDFKVEDFSYKLQEDRIAKFPLSNRDESKLLIYKEGTIEDSHYLTLSRYIPEESLMIFNQTKVIQARIHFENETGAIIEVFCLAPALENQDPMLGMQQTESVRWVCLVGKLSKWKQEVLTTSIDGVELEARRIEQCADGYIIEFTWSPSHLSFADILEKVGKMPIPPYLKRQSIRSDNERYQTVYALQKGSVAAPTAGLHFTERVFASLTAKNVKRAYLTLHVGTGTFKPIKTETVGGHIMHTEWIEVELKTIELLLVQLEQNKPIISVGTTSLRTMESLYWIGVKLIMNPELHLDEMKILQWEAYEMKNDIPALDAMNAIKNWMKINNKKRLTSTTQLIITPMYQVKMIDALITNFHQTHSTLLLLVGAVIGEDWKKVYQHAITKGYRFLSYGDGSLLWLKK